MRRLTFRFLMCKLYVRKVVFAMLKERITQLSLPPFPQSREQALDMLLREEYGTLPSAPHSVTATLQKNDAKFCAGKADLQGRYLRKVSECLAFDGFLSDFLWKTQKPSARRSFPSYRWLCSVFIFRSVRKKDSVISVCLSVCLKIIANLDIDVNPLFVYFFDFPKNIVSQLCE